MQKIKMGGSYSQNGRDSSTFKILTGKSIEKIPLVRHTRIWKDNIRMYLKGIDFKKRNWIDVADSV